MGKQREKQDLLEELRLLPENAVVRRINELVKRARSVKVHAYIIHYLRKQMPYVMGKQDKQVGKCMCACICLLTCHTHVLFIFLSFIVPVLFVGARALCKRFVV